MSAVESHIPAPLQTARAEQRERSVAQWLGQPGLSVAISIGEENVLGADVREVTFTVLNLAREACSGLYMLDVVMGTAADGGPAGMQTVAWTVGTARTVVANQQFEVLTNAQGVAKATVQVTGAATRHIRAMARGVVQGSGAVSWT